MPLVSSSFPFLSNCLRPTKGFTFYFAASTSFLYPVVRSRTANVSAWILMFDPHSHPQFSLSLPSSSAVIPASFTLPRHPRAFPRAEFAGDHRNANTVEVVWYQRNVLSCIFIRFRRRRVKANCFVNLWAVQWSSMLTTVGDVNWCEVS